VSVQEILCLNNVGDKPMLYMTIYDSALMHASKSDFIYTTFIYLKIEYSGSHQRNKGLQG